MEGLWWDAICRGGRGRVADMSPLLIVKAGWQPPQEELGHTGWRSRLGPALPPPRFPHIGGWVGHPRHSAGASVLPQEDGLAQGPARGGPRKKAISCVQSWRVPVPASESGPAAPGESKTPPSSRPDLDPGGGGSEPPVQGTKPAASPCSPLPFCTEDRQWFPRGCEHPLLCTSG